MGKCEACYGRGITDNHVTGEVCCAACEGTGIDEDAEMSVVDTTDELHQILGEALSAILHDESRDAT